MLIQWNKCVCVSLILQRKKRRQCVLDSMILRVFSNLNDSMILWFYVFLLIKLWSDITWLCNGRWLSSRFLTSLETWPFLRQFLSLEHFNKGGPDLRRAAEISDHNYSKLGYLQPMWQPQTSHWKNLPCTQQLHQQSVNMNAVRLRGSQDPEPERSTSESLLDSCWTWKDEQERWGQTF